MSGRQARTIFKIARWCSAASAFIASEPRARAFNAVAVELVSVSHDGLIRAEAVFSIAGSFWPRKRARSSSGAAMTRLNTCL